MDACEHEPVKLRLRRAAHGLAFVCALFSLFDWHSHGALWWLGVALGVAVGELLSES